MHKQVRLTVFDLHKDVWSERNVIVTYVMRCMICYILCNSKNVKKHPRRSVTFSTVAGFISPATLLKVTLLHVCFHSFWIMQMIPNRAKCLMCTTDILQ